MKSLLFTSCRIGPWMVMFGLASVAGPLSLDTVLFSGGGSSGRSARFGLDGSIGQGVAESTESESNGLGLRAGFWSQVVPWLEDSDSELRVEVELQEGVPLRVTLRSAATPGRTYTVQSAGALEGPWSALARPVAGSDGSLVYTDAVGNGDRFYRLTD